MIEWVPIKEFISQGIDEDEECLFYDNKEVRIVITSIDTLKRERILPSFTYAAKINLPKEKTLEQKFVEHYRESKIVHQMPNIDRAIISDFAVIAKQHYEGEK